MPDMGLIAIIIVIIIVAIVGFFVWRVRGIEEDEEEELFSTDTRFGEDAIDDLDDFDQDPEPAPTSTLGAGTTPPGTGAEWGQVIGAEPTEDPLLPADEEILDDDGLDNEDLDIEDELLESDENGLFDAESDEDEPLTGDGSNN